MQSDIQKNLQILDYIQENYSIVIDKIYSRQNPPVSNEVKEIHFVPDSKNFVIDIKRKNPLLKIQLTR